MERETSGDFSTGSHDASSNWEESEDFDNNLNCPGVISVRIISVQGLSCPVGSSVVAVVSLPPFSGCVKTDRIPANLAVDGSGVSATWSSEQDGSLCRMVNSWNSQDSPVPSIKIEIRFSPIGSSLLDFTMCTFCFSCQPLLKDPCRWRTKSFYAQNNAELSGTDEKNYMGACLRLRAMFEPDKLRNRQKHDQTTNTSKIASFSEVPKTMVHSLENSCEVSTERASSESNSTEREAQTLRTPHLLRIYSFLIPGECSVCQKILVGRRAGFLCEVCGIGCCRDCQLNVDIQIPCDASNKLQAIGAVRGKTTVDKMLSIVAPDESYNKQIQQKLESAKADYDQVKKDTSPADRIGTLKIQILKSKVFSECIGTNVDPNDRRMLSQSGREGNYYIRLTSSDASEKTWRSQGVFLGGSSNVLFRDASVAFPVRHYGENFWLECVETSTDEVVGAALVSFHGLLQAQRENIGIGKLQRKLLHEARDENAIISRLVLRHGARDLITINQEQSHSETWSDSESKEKGSISGWVEVAIRADENIELLYSLSRPVRCRTRPESDLHMGKFQSNLKRLGTLSRRLHDIFEMYDDLVRWEHPIQSGIWFFLLLLLCARMDSEYIGCLPFAVLIWIMSRNLPFTKNAGTKANFVRNEASSWVQKQRLELAKSPNARLFGLVEVSIHSGKNLYSRDLGLQGKTFCNVIFNQNELGSKEGYQRSDPESSFGSWVIGSTITALSANPNWKQLHICTPETKRLVQILRQSDHFLSQTENGTVPWLQFPVFLPKADSNVDSDFGLYASEPFRWERSKAFIAIVVQLGLGFTETVGEVRFPIARLVEKGEIKGWFPLYKRDTRLHSADALDDQSIESDEPCIFVHLKWKQPYSKLSHDQYGEVSKIIQEELFFALQKARNRQLTIVENSIEAVNSALGVGGFLQSVQNTIGAIVDTLERVEHLLNFTDPYKSVIVFVAVIMVFLVSIVVKTRYLLLCAVLEQFIPGLLARMIKLIHVGQWSKRASSSPTRGKEKILTIGNAIDLASRFVRALQIWTLNAFHTLPTKDDLRRAYFWEIRKVKADLSRQENELIRYKKLTLLWRAVWYSEIEFVDGDSETGPKTRKAFALIEGQHFVWWTSVAAFDAGDLVAGYITLKGHSGLTSTSPHELQGVSSAMQSRVITIFGRGKDGQKRLTILLPTLLALEEIKATVSDIPNKSE